MKGASLLAVFLAFVFCSCNPNPYASKSEKKAIGFTDSCQKGRYLAHKDIKEGHLKYYLFSDGFYTPIGDSIERKCGITFIYAQTCRVSKARSCYNEVADSIVMAVMGRSFNDLWLSDH
jgi:hypothetical protein